MSLMQRWSHSWPMAMSLVDATGVTFVAMAMSLVHATGVTFVAMVFSLVNGTGVTFVADGYVFVVAIAMVWMAAIPSRPVPLLPRLVDG